MPRLILLLTIILCTANAQAQSDSDWNKSIPAEVVILQSTKSYAAAMKTARGAASALRLKLDLEDYKPDKSIGLSMTPKDCADNGYDYPAYIPRGNGMLRPDRFISIEYSDGYEGFAKGYYIVVAMVATPGSDAIINTLALVKGFSPQAYSKRTKVFFGCMH